MTRDARARANRFIVAEGRRGSISGAFDPRASDDLSEHSTVTVRVQSFPRLFGAILRILWGLSLVLGSAVGIAWAVYHYATTSPRFAVKEVQVQGCTRMTNQQVLSGSGIVLGDNLFKLNLGTVEIRLLKNPWFSQVKVTRKMPSTISVEIQEREAAALAVITGQLFLVNRLGEPFKEASSDDPSDLPMITGISVDDGPRDLGLFRQRIALGLDVLNHYSQCRLSKSYSPEEVHLTPGGEVVMTLGHKGTTLHLGVGHWSKKFAMAERILARLQAQRSTPALIFLDNRANPDRVVVRVN
jgi:cell division protein FtsQ